MNSNELADTLSASIRAFETLREQYVSAAAVNDDELFETAEIALDQQARAVAMLVYEHRTEVDAALRAARTRVVSVHHCSVCHQDHEQLRFFLMPSPVYLNSDAYDWAGICPISLHPIFLKDVTAAPSEPGS